MRLTTSHPRRANRGAVPAPSETRSVLRAVSSIFLNLGGRRRREAERARQQFEGLEVDQRVRTLGEW